MKGKNKIIDVIENALLSPLVPPINDANIESN
jgi:hypothetical protein